MIILNSICFSEVQGVLTDQTASKTNHNHIDRLSEPRTITAARDLQENDITSFL